MGGDQITITCTRCGGTGHYSFNLKDGTRCYGCAGTGRMQTTENAASAKAKRVANRVSKTAMRARLAAEVLSELDATFGPFTLDYAGSYARCVACQKAYGKTPGDIVSERLRSAA